MYKMYKEDENCWECQQKKFKKGGDKKWIQKAVKGMRKDKPCTGNKFGGPSCPPGSKQYNLAKVFRAMAKKRKKQMGGQTAPMNQAQDIGANNINYFKSMLKGNALNAAQENMINNAAQQQMMMPNYDDGGNIFGQTSYGESDPNAQYYLDAFQKPKETFDIYGYAQKLDDNFYKAQEYNRLAGPEDKTITKTKFDKKQLRADIASADPIISNQAKEFKKDMKGIMQKNRKANTKIFFDKLNPFTPDPTDPRSPNNQFQNQYGGSIKNNDMNYNNFNNTPAYNMGGSSNYMYNGQDTGMTAEQFYQYQLETEGPLILPDGTDTGMARAQFIDMQNQQMPQMHDGGAPHTHDRPEVWDNRFQIANNPYYGYNPINFATSYGGTTYPSQAPPSGTKWAKNKYGYYRPQVAIPSMGPGNFIRQSLQDYPLYTGTPTTQDAPATSDNTSKSNTKTKSKSGSSNGKTKTQTVENTSKLLSGKDTGDNTKSSTDPNTTESSDDIPLAEEYIPSNYPQPRSNIYTPGPQIGYAGVPVLQGNNLVPGLRMKNNYVPGGYGVAPVAYNAAETVLRDYKNVQRSGGLAEALFGKKMKTRMKFDHRMGNVNPNTMTPAQQQQYIMMGDATPADDNNVVIEDAVSADDPVTKSTSSNNTSNTSNTNSSQPNQKPVFGRNTNPTSKLGQEPNTIPENFNPVLNEPIVVEGDSTDTPTRRIQEEMAKGKGRQGYYVKGGAIKKYNMGGNMELSALHEEMKALDARKNELQAMMANVQFGRGQAQLPTSMNQLPMANTGMEVNNPFTNPNISEDADTETGNWLDTDVTTTQKTKGALDPALAMQMGIDGAYGIFKGLERSAQDRKNKQRIEQGTVMAGFEAVGEDRGNYMSNNPQMMSPINQEYPTQFDTYTSVAKHGGPIEIYNAGGSFNNPGFNNLPEAVQQKIKSNSSKNYAHGGGHMEYNEGGEYFLTDDQIQQFLQAGGEIEIIE